MNKEELFFKIEALLDGALLPEEAAAFEREIAGSPELAREIERQRLERQAVEYLRAQQLREKMRDWPLPPPVEETPYVRRSPLNIALWLAFAISMISGLLYVGNNWFGKTPDNPAGMPEKTQFENKPSDEQADATGASSDSLSGKHPRATNQHSPSKQQSNRYAALADDYFEKKDYLGSFRGKEDYDEDSLVAAAKAREEHRLADAAELLRALHPDYPQAQEMLGQVLFEQGKYRDAAAVYETLAHHATGSDDKQQFEWKWALCLLAAYPYDKERMESLLDSLAAKSPRGRANELKEKIKSMK